MKNWKYGTISILAMMTVLLMSAGGFAFAENKTPMTPELAAKKERVLKQREQRITNVQRKEAAESLKAQRTKVYKARQAARHSGQVPTHHNK